MTPRRRRVKSIQVSRAEDDTGGRQRTSRNVRNENIRNGRAARANLSLAEQRNTKWGGKIPRRKVAEVVKRDSGRRNEARIAGNVSRTDRYGGDGTPASSKDCLCEFDHRERRCGIARPKITGGVEDQTPWRLNRTVAVIRQDNVGRQGYGQARRSRQRRRVELEDRAAAVVGNPQVVCRIKGDPSRFRQALCGRSLDLG